MLKSWRNLAVGIVSCYRETLRCVGEILCCDGKTTPYVGETDTRVGQLPCSDREPLPQQKKTALLDSLP